MFYNILRHDLKEELTNTGKCKICNGFATPLYENGLIRLTQHNNSLFIEHIDLKKNLGIMEVDYCLLCGKEIL